MISQRRTTGSRLGNQRGGGREAMSRFSTAHWAAPTECWCNSCEIVQRSPEKQRDRKGTVDFSNYGVRLPQPSRIGPSTSVGGRPCERRASHSHASSPSSCTPCFGTAQSSEPRRTSAARHRRPRRAPERSTARGRAWVMAPILSHAVDPIGRLRFQPSHPTPR